MEDHGVCGVAASGAATETASCVGFVAYCVGCPVKSQVTWSSSLPPATPAVTHTVQELHC